MIGGGGHGKVLLEEFKAQWDFHSVLSKTPLNEEQTAYFQSEGLNVVLESDNILNALWEEGIHHAVVALGDNHQRQQVTEALLARGFTVPSLIHPNAFVASTAQVSLVGVQILAGSHVGASATIGKGSIVNHQAIVEHDAVLGNYVHVAPHAVLLGASRLASKSLLGANATILPNVTVGLTAEIGAGAVVTKDIPVSGTYVGIPARLL